MSKALFAPPPPPRPRGPITDADAIDIWIARWVRVRPSELVRRYQCDPRRLYEIWEGVKFPGSRERALEIFARRYPSLGGRFDPGQHRRVPVKPGPDQMSLF